MGRRSRFGASPFSMGHVMRELSGGDRVGCSAGSWLLQALVVFALAFFGRCSHAQASGALAANVVVCGPPGLAGVAYVNVSNHPVDCGRDANGNLLYAQLSQQLVAVNVDDTTDDGGSVVGLATGGAVLGVLALAFGFRLLRGFFNASSEG